MEKCIMFESRRERINKREKIKMPGESKEMKEHQFLKN